MRNLLLQKDFVGIFENALCFETFYKSDIENNCVSNNQSSPFFPSAVSILYDLLILGKSFPDLMIMNHIRHYGNALAATLYLNESDIFTERTFELVSIIDRIERFGSLGFVGAPQRIEKLLGSLYQFLPSEENEPKISERELGSMLGVGIDVLHNYLALGQIPNIDLPEKKEPLLLEKKGDWVICEADSIRSIDYLFSKGYKYGVCFSKEKVIIFKRSSLINVPLEKLAKKIGEYQILDNFLIINTSMSRDVVVTTCNDFLKGA